MKYILGFEHIRRLVGAHSQLVTTLGQHLAMRGHDVTILCDTVNDPVLYPELRFVARRTFQTGQSHRPVLLHAWARRVLDRVDHDVVISFHAAIPGDVVFPTFGLALRPPHRRIPMSIQRVDPRRLLSHQVARSVLMSPQTRVVGALSEKMADDLVVALPQIEPRLKVVRGASSIQPADSPEQGRLLRTRLRRMLKIGDDDVAFLWVGRVPRRRWVEGMLDALSRAMLEGHDSAILVVASEDTWPIHDLAVDYGCDANLRFVGYSSRVADLLCAADVGLHIPARSTWGRFAWDCIASGLPVIATTDAAAVECLRTEDRRMAGHFVPGAQPSQLLDGIIAMLDPSIRARAGDVARSLAPAAQFGAFVDRIEALAAELTQAN